jgi:4-hydroxy-tetrahydrodipicolinate synthase
MLKEDMSVDFDSMHKNYDRLIEAGINGLVLLGSSGEFYAFDKMTIIDIAKDAIDYIDKRVPIIVGTGRLSAIETIEVSNEVLKLGADSVIIVGPYYIQASQEGIYKYFDSIASEIKGDIYIYNYPENVGYDISENVLKKLIEKHKNIVGLKDTVPTATHTENLIVKIKSVYPNFKIYTGYDNNIVSIATSGGNGCIGALSNIIPKICSGIAKDLNDKDAKGIINKKRMIDKLMEFYSISIPFMPAMKYLLELNGYANTSKCFYPAIDLDENQKNAVERYKNFTKIVDLDIK